MRQNMEELQATQEEVSRKERAYIARIQELESVDNRGAVAAAVEAERERFAGREREQAEKIAALEQQLAVLQNTKPDGWETAEQFEKTLKVNLEALRITGEALSRNV